MSTAAFELSKREAALVRLSDVELVTRTYELVQKIDNDKLSDDFYWHLTEAFERFAPNAEWQERVRAASEHTLEHRQDELETTLPNLAARAAARWMARSINDA